MAAEPAALPDARSRYEQEPLSALWVINVLLRRRRLIIGCAIVLAALLDIMVLIQPRWYTSTASFMPQAARQVANLSALASQFGLALPGGEATQSPAFYADLMQSREILGTLAAMPFAHTRDGATVTDTLVSILELREKNPARRREEAIKWLRDNLAVATNQRTGVVTFGITMKEPGLSALVAAAMLGRLNAFNLESRQSRAAAERRFAEQRLAEVKQELRDAEDRLLAFLQRNRDFGSGSELRFQQDRLQRDVNLRQQVFTTLAQSVEQARIDEVRDTPVITVVEHPEAPVRPDPRGLVKKGLLGLVLGSLLGIVVAFLSDGLSRSQTTRRDVYDEFVSLRQEALSELKNPLRAVRRRGTT
jgi:uncharacterized protein involved in exopolysaccharide biosynthesis